MKTKQKGMALVVTLSLMTMALILGVSSMQSSILDEASAGTNRAAANAFMAAEYGAAELLELHGSTSPSSLSSCSPVPSVGGFQTVGNIQDNTVSYQYEVCREGSDFIRVTVDGVASDVKRRLQAKIKITSPTSDFSDLSAINFPTKLSNFEAPSSNSFVVEGLVDDSFSGGFLPAIATDGQQAYLESKIGSGRMDNYFGGVSNEIGNSILADPNVFQEFVEMLKDYAIKQGRAFSSIDTTGNKSGRTDLGSPENPKITYVTGNLEMSGSAGGAGILIVDGNYGTSGTPYFEGLVIVLGDTFGISGGGNGGLSGALVLSPMSSVTINEEPVYEYREAKVVTSGGGAANYAHDASALSSAFSLLPQQIQDFWMSNNNSIHNPPSKRLESWRELLY